jgi:putative ABC transport system permease protein
MMKDIQAGNDIEVSHTAYEYSDLLNLTFKLMVNTDIYEKAGDIWVDKSSDDVFMTEAVNNAASVKVVGILRPTANSSAMNANGTVGYTAALTKHLVDSVNDSGIVKEQKANPEIDVFTGMPFNSGESGDFDMSSLSGEQKSKLASLSEDEQTAALASLWAESQSTYDDNLIRLGVSDIGNPDSIRIYPKDFASKEKIADIISGYNKSMTDKGKSESVIEYTDYTEMLMSSVNNVINGISYVLIAFVAISLVVSSIMIGII